MKILQVSKKKQTNFSIEVELMTKVSWSIFVKD